MKYHFTEKAKAETIKARLFMAVCMSFIFVYIGCVIHGESFIKWIWPLFCLWNAHKQIMTLFHFLETVLLFSSVNLKIFKT